jgi:hypothetical protein
MEYQQTSHKIDFSGTRKVNQIIKTCLFKNKEIISSFIVYSIHKLIRGRDEIYFLIRSYRIDGLQFSNP